MLLPCSKCTLVLGTLASPRRKFPNQNNALLDASLLPSTDIDIESLENDSGSDICPEE